MQTKTAEKINANPQLRVLAAFMVLLSAVGFSGKAVLVKLAYRFEIDTVSLLALRMLFSLPFFIINARIGYIRQKRKNKSPVNMGTADWLQLAALGVSGYYLASLFDFIGLQYVSAGLERLILFLYPTIVLILSAIFFNKKVQPAQYVALFLTYTGIALAMLDTTHSNGNNTLTGAAFIFGSALTYAIYLVGSVRFISILGSVYYTSVAMIVASVVILIHHAWVGGWQLWHYPADLYMLVAVMAIFSTVLPTLLVSEGLRIIGAANTAIISSFGPVATIFMGSIFLDEPFGGWQIPGTILVLAGVLWISLAKR
jgi:drug/metabolite transporter (DMT)-like permease